MGCALFAALSFYTLNSTFKMSSFQDILRQYWGYDNFRGIQEDIIRSITAGRDTLGLMPTGGGKSITFQVPALAMEGMTIVVTPLISLMKDQVEHLRHRNITAAAIHSGQSHEEVLKHLDNSILGAYKLLYVSPERLGTDIFRNKVRRMNVSFITVDEAHCISQWGYDFRPSYLEIAKIRDLLPEVPVLALTATATPHVIDDICRQLHFRPGQAVFRMSFARQNLRYIVRKTPDKLAELLHILRSVAGSAIIYTRSRRNTVELTQQLKAEGFTAYNYHAGLSDTDKDVRQRAWQEDAVRIMVATNAFGMGIDKADVRLVIHMDLPDSPEAYFQEAGRAGRDGQTAYAVLLYNNGDHGKMLRRIPETFPEKEYIGRVYDSLAYFFQLAVGDGYQVTYEFSLERFCINFKFFPVPAESALHILSRAGYIDYREAEENTSRIVFLLGRDDLYRIDRIGGDTDRALQALLRLYGGLFADYVYIDEQRIANEAGLTREEVYEALKLLNRMRIAHYIPRKNTPYITYLTRREPHIQLSREVYEDRREDYARRVQAILEYAANDNVCRSRYLLDYFADPEATDCGHCDVCLEKKRRTPDTKELTAQILEQLSDGKAYSPDQICAGQCSPALRNEVLVQLVQEGEIIMKDGTFLLA